MSLASVDIETATGDPSRYFQSPIDIAEHPSLRTEEKRKLLQVWEVDAEELETAADENMAGGESSRLSEVKDALRLVGGAD